MDLKQLGNIYSSNGEFTTKAAILQSYYRASINEKCGLGSKNVKTGEKADGKPELKSVVQEYGHLVSGGESRNINFYYPETFEYAKCRVNNKNPDETINHGIDSRNLPHKANVLLLSQVNIQIFNHRLPHQSASDIAICCDYKIKSVIKN